MFKIEGNSRSHKFWVKNFWLVWGLNRGPLNSQARALPNSYQRISKESTFFERPIDSSSSNKVGKNLPPRGIEPGSAAWQSGMLTTRPLSFISNFLKNSKFKVKFCQLSIKNRISLSLHNARNLACHEKKYHSSLWPGFLSPKKLLWHQIWVSRIFWQFFSPLNDFKKVS